jgi:hypothetical protein
MDDPFWEVMHVVLQFSKYYRHTKFQVNISNGCRVLEAIPSKKRELWRIAGDLVAQNLSFNKKIILMSRFF